MEKKYENLLNWWLNLDPLTQEESAFLNKKNVDSPIFNDGYIEAEKEFFSKLLFSNISQDTYKLEVANTASEMIKKIFSMYVDDDTLVICSHSEHETPIGCVEEVKNKLYIEVTNFNIDEYYNEIKKYKKVFVYIIGTGISTGIITPQIVYEKLKNTFESLGIKSTIVCDDVHGMFVTPRDYSIFDYIIGTAHALNKPYDMGILISKKDNPEIGIKATNWVATYNKMLDIILKRRDKLNLFYKVMSIVLEKYIIRKEFSFIPGVTPNIFSMAMPKFPLKEQTYLDLKSCYVRIEGYEDKSAPNYFIRLRSQQYIANPELCIKGIDLLLKTLDRIVYCWDNLT